MQEDPSKEDEFRSLDQWEKQKHPDRIYVPNQTGSERTKNRFSFNSNSLSGNERNRLFLRHGENFADVTLVSGVDDIADGRSFAVVDFDQDGWQDIALMSLNAPRFKLYRNQMQNYFPENHALRFRLVGGQTDSTASSQFSNRDAIGAIVKIEFESGKTSTVQKQCGEGFASQNSEVLFVGIPPGDIAKRLEVRWPSGLVTRIDDPDRATIFTIKEDVQ